MQRYDAIVIGGGHNGLVHAAYLARAGKKTADPLEDLRKARWYLDREISRLEKAVAR